MECITHRAPGRALPDRGWEAPEADAAEAERGRGEATDRGEATSAAAAAAAALALCLSHRALGGRSASAAARALSSWTAVV